MKHLADITSYIRTLHGSEHFHLLLVHGPAGWGKSSLTRQVLGELGLAYQLLGSYSTPLALFNMLVQNPEGLLVIDDTAGLFHNASAMAILNAATWPGADSGGRRRVMWTSTSEKSLAAEVDFKGKLIALTNHVPETPQARAFKNRALNYRLTIEPNNVGLLLGEAARSTDHFANTDLAVEVASHLGDEAKRRKSDEISLRTLRLAYELAQADQHRWRDLLEKALPASPTQTPEELVLELSGSGVSVERQAAEFAARSSLGRRKFFHLRQQLGLTSETRATAQRTSALSRTRARASAEGDQERSR